MLAVQGALTVHLSAPVIVVVVFIAVLALIAVAALCVVALSVARCAESLRRSADSLERDGGAILAEVRLMSDRAEEQSGRSVELRAASVIRAGGYSGRDKKANRATVSGVGLTSRLAYAAVGEPLIKAAAFGAGTARVAERIRDRRKPATGLTGPGSGQSRPVALVGRPRRRRALAEKS